jgi:hypothetical protein
MSVLESFFIQFKTDANAARADIQQLDAQISKLADKNKKLDEGETKRLKELKTLRQEQIQHLKATNEQTDSLAASFVKMGVAAAATLFTLDKLKDGLIGAVNYNAAVEKSAKLTGINARELATLNSAVAAAGGNPGSSEYLDFITKLNQQYAGLGINDRVKRVNGDLRKTADIIAEMNARNPGSGQSFAALQGIPQDLYFLLEHGGAKYDELIAKASKFNNTTEQTAKAGFEINQEWQYVIDEFRSGFNDMIPLAKFLADVFLVFAGAVRSLADGLGGLFRFAQAGVQLLSGNTHGAVKSSNKGWSDLADMADNWSNINQHFGAKGAPAAVVAAGNNSSSILPLISQYESSNRNVLNASGPGGTPASTASGYYQITNGTWRDIAPQAGVSLAQYPTAMSAPQDVQTKVASLLYQQRGIAPWASDTRLLAAIGQGSLAQADSAGALTTYGGNSKSLSVGSVTVNTQATNAAGVANDFHSELANVYSHTLDGELF